MEEFLSFKLSDDFIKSYEVRKVNWGFPIGGGNTLGEITFLTKYSRVKEDGAKERWHEVCRRVVEGYYSILKDHCKNRRTNWNENKAQAAAQDAYERMFEFKWLPPGRGLWAMGTRMVNEDRNGSPLYNCAFLSTGYMSSRSTSDATFPFARLTEMSMNGIGVSTDTNGVGKLALHKPLDETYTFVVPDSREGWAESVGVLLESFFFKNRKSVVFDYSLVRPAGAPVKRFGGVASGPGPLRNTHETIRQLLSDREGELINSRDIVDICNLAGKAVVAGGSRRSAILCLGDKDDDVFVNLKNWTLEENQQRMALDGTGWGQMSNNTVAVHDNEYPKDIIDSIVVNGEPGIFNIDMAREMGRMLDGKTYSDMKVEGVNPCVTGDTWILTDIGARRVDDLVGSKFNALVNGRSYETISDGFWKTGNKPVLELSLVDGQRLKLTTDHRVLAVSESGEPVWVEAGNLDIGQQVVIHDHGTDVHWDGKGSSDDGYVLGSLVGDGAISDKRAFVAVWDTDPGSGRVKEKLTSIMNSMGHRSDAGWFLKSDGVQRRFGTAALTELAASYDIVRYHKTVTSQVEEASSDFYRGFLQGLFDADGHVEGYSTSGGVSVRLSSIDLKTLEATQRMLARLGIKSAIRSMHPEEYHLWPDGKTYKSKESYRLIISGSSAARYMENIGFSNSEKTNKWNSRTSDMKRGFYQKPFRVEVSDIVQLGNEDVYDCTVDRVNAFDANGLYVHNCAEATLEHAEVCNLNELFPYHHESLEDFKKTIKHAYLYCKAVTLLPTDWPETNEVLTRNRRIGTSVAGVAQFIEDRGRSTLRTWLDEGYKSIKERDKQYSEWLGIRESIKVSVVKPGGTVPLLCGATPGVHWPVASYGYIRRQRFRRDDPLLEFFVEAGYHVEDSVSDENDAVVEFYTKGPELRTEREVSVWEKVATAVMMQRYWADQAVSATFTFVPEEEKDIGHVIAAYGDQLKTLSFMPLGEELSGGAYKQMPYEAILKEDFEERYEAVAPMPFEKLYNGQVIEDVQADKFCTTDRCEI